MNYCCGIAPSTMRSADVRHVSWIILVCYDAGGVAILQSLGPHVVVKCHTPIYPNPNFILCISCPLKRTYMYMYCRHVYSTFATKERYKLLSSDKYYTCNLRNCSMTSVFKLPYPQAQLVICGCHLVEARTLTFRLLIAFDLLCG